MSGHEGSLWHEDCNTCFGKQQYLLVGEAAVLERVLVQQVAGLLQSARRRKGQRSDKG